MLVLVLGLVVGTAPVALAFGGHGGFHGGGFGHRGFAGGGFRHFHARHFHSGVFFDVAPLWLAPAPYYVAPAPYIGVIPAPPAVWYYCTDPPGYYPTVPTCNVPWIPVDP